MAYNKAKAEREWLQWKEAEEKTMREQGVDEDAIQRLHEYDWKSFKAERNYQRWQIPSDEYIRQLVAEEDELHIDEVEQLLESIENQQLHAVLSNADNITLQILLYKIQGFTSLEISEKTGLKETTVRKRISRIKNNFKFS